ncbi:MAG: HAMP domain-containing histidine kinase [Bacteroidales bacterium]|jgi:signal transduction histidine kinase|nr:HAMP domain-containing histidine kinase [Bacteroidales bacterium]
MDNIQSQNITDEVLLNELSSRIEKYKNAVESLNTLNKQLLDLNKKLSESEAMKSHFISNITNEIINPFASILGLSKSIVECPDTDVNRMKRMASLIHREAFSLDFQFKNIFAAAEIEAGEIQPIIAVVNIDELIASLFEQYSREIEIKRLVKVCKNLNPDGQQILFKTDQDKLQVILSNLLCNAINFNRPDHKVEISFGTNEAGELYINVIDEGLGISPENQKIIYDRFMRVDTGINSINRGHGLGLSINKAYIDLLGGRLELESLENSGSRFTVIIPESQESSSDYSDEGNEVFFGDSELEMF